MVAIVNVRLYDFVTYCPNGYVVFDDVIVESGPMTAFQGADQVIDGAGKLLMPGLINFHTHIYGAFARGFDFGVAPKKFSQVLESKWWRLDRELRHEDLYWSAIAYGKESLKKGVVGVLDHNASGVIEGSTACIEDALEALGMHGLTCFETSDRFPVQAAISENLTCLQRKKGLFGMHASMTLSEETLIKIRAKAMDIPIHIHVSEGIEDHVAHGITPIARLHQHRLIAKDSLLVHGVHMTEEDAATIKQTGAVLAINTRSNLNNAVGTVDFQLIQSNDIPFVAGTDGLGANVAASWQDLYFSAKLKMGDPSGVSLGLIQKALVEGYAYYERLTGLKLGRFSPGYRMDAMLIDYEAFTPMDEENAFGHVFFGVFDALNISDLWIGGKAVIESYGWVHPKDVPTEIAEKLWCRLGEVNE